MINFGILRPKARQGIMNTYTGRARPIINRLYSVSTYDDAGREAYYVVRLNQDMEAPFLSAMEGRAAVDYAQFGKIVASGFGHEPDPYTLAMLKAVYAEEAAV
jgi:hypothetical protein